MPSPTIAEKHLEQDFISNDNPITFVKQCAISAQSIVIKLHEHGFSLISVQSIPYGQQLRLSCGAIINVYDKGTVFVQGKLDNKTRMNTLGKLKQVLPENTRWGI